MSSTTPEEVAPSGAAPARTFLCPDCQHSFSRREYVTRHRKSAHLGERKQVCEDCGNGFARTDLLKRHRKTCAFVAANAKDGGFKRTKVDDIPKTVSQPLGNDIYILPPDPSTSLPADFTILPLSSILDGNSSSSTSPSSESTGTSPNSTGSSTNSPPISYGTDFSLPPNTFNDATLAPSFGARNGNTATAEMSASLALEDLVNMPFISSASSIPDSMPYSTDSLSTWPSASPPDSNTLSYGQGDAGLEYSPEAQALATYFNQGGIGGITALDLGFSYEPSLFPDRAFEPQYVHEAPEPRFLFPREQYSRTFLSPWNIPSLATLSRYAANATNKFLTGLPVVHPGTLQISDVHTHTAFALTVVGGAYEADGQAYSNKILTEKRVYIIKSAAEPMKTDAEKFSLLQSMVLYQLLGLFHREEYQRHFSHTFHGSLVMMLRQNDLVNRIKRTPPLNIHAGLAGKELETMWKRWIEVETWRRVSFIVYLCDLEVATVLQSPPLMSYTELAIDVPGSEALWNAKSSSEWLNAYLSRTVTQPMPFLEALSALLRPTPPTPYSSAAIVLAELGRLGQFPLLILTRTLSFLEREVQQARNRPAGEDILHEGAPYDPSLVERIQRGREVLKSLPGGAKRAGGEKWYEGVMPRPPPERLGTPTDLENVMIGARGSTCWTEKNMAG